MPAPPDEELIALRPKNPTHIKILLDAAVLAGYDAKGMVDTRSYKVPPKAQPRFADPDVPVLVMQPRIVPARGGAEDDLWDEDAMPAPVQPAVEVVPEDEEPEPPESPLDTAGAEDDLPPDDIFALIQRGRSAMEHKR